MATLAPFSTPSVAVSKPHPATGSNSRLPPAASLSFPRSSRVLTKRGSSAVVSAFGDVSGDGTAFLVAGAIGVALIGTAFPILFARKDMCPECDGAGFVRKAGVRLKANAARKDVAQIVCPRCNGLGKLGQIDK